MLKTHARCSGSLGAKYGGIELSEMQRLKQL